jgi:hypothetical protein
MTIKFKHYTLSDNKIFTICSIKNGDRFTVGYSIFSENTKHNINKRGGGLINWTKKVANDLAIKSCLEYDISFDVSDFRDSLGSGVHCYYFLYRLMSLKTIILFLRGNKNYNHKDTIDELFNIFTEDYLKYHDMITEKFLRFFMKERN